MSSSFWREPLTAIIRQENVVVGAICLPEEDIADFIEEFNYCYFSMRLWIEPLESDIVPKLTATTGIRPIGAGYRRAASPQTGDAESAS